MTTKYNSSPIYPTISGFAIMCLALGLGRFAYTPLLPIMVSHHWLTESVASYIGAANFLGYLIGALIAKPLTRFKPDIFWIRINIYLCALSLLACIFHVNAAWLMGCRTLAGLSGAILMVLTPSVIYKAIQGHHIPLVSGIVFGGIGAGIIFSSLIVPWLSQYSVTETWEVIGAASILLSIIALLTLPKTHQAKNSSPTDKKQQHHWAYAIILLFIAYSLFGYGAVPHLLYMVAYSEDVLKATTLQADLAWLLYGIGNAIGSPIFGYLSHHRGKGACLVYTYLIATLSLVILFFSHDPWIGFISFALNGIVANSIVSLTSAYLATLAPLQQQTHFWSIFTVFVALFQTAGSFLMASWMGTSWCYPLMFASSAFAMLLAALCVLTTLKTGNKKPA